MKKATLSIITLFALILAGLSAINLPVDNNAFSEPLIDNGTIKTNPDAFIYILNMGMVCTENPTYLKIVYKFLANGFAVGNGKYVVTAAHCVKDFENSHFVLRQPIVISPYYGDLFEARIIAVDKTNDVAILEVLWETHPALELETASDWKHNKTIQITGYPPRALERGGTGVPGRKIMIEETRLRNVNGSGAYEIQLGPVNYPGKGWSGSPLINPETGKVVGILTKERYQEKWFILKDHLIMGCSVDSIKQLFARDHLHEGAGGTFASSPGAVERFDLVLGALDEIVDPGNKQKMALKKLCEDLPFSHLAHLPAGWVSGPAGMPYLVTAIEMAPDNTLLRATYGRKLLCNEKYKEAAEQFQAVIDQDPDHLFANYGLLVSLSMIDLEKAQALGKTLTDRWPENEVFWFECSKIFRAQEKYNDQLSAIQEAIKLSAYVPYLYQRQLADALWGTGQLDKSEQAFLDLLETHMCENCWQAYTSLLSQMDPSKIDLSKQAKAKAFRSKHDCK